VTSTSVVPPADPPRIPEAAWAVTARAHGGAGMELVERLPSGEFGFATFSLGVLQALRPASELTSDSHRWVSNASAGAPAVIVDMSDQWALDRLAHEAACAGARILGRAEASGMWAGYVFHPM
jgi:hypothetical protein